MAAGVGGGNAVVVVIDVVSGTLVTTSTGAVFGFVVRSMSGSAL